MAKKDAKINLLDHSEAKVGLYGRYLSIFLNILSRSPINTIHLFDLFCGEGVFEDGGKGSPIVALETIRNHFFNNNKTCPNINIVFNDTGFSEIEPTKLKTDRVKENASKIFKPKNVNVGYVNIDYSVLIEKVINRTDKLRSNERALVFIDPWGYKEIDPNDIKKLLSNGKTEVILFLPIYFMARFVEKSRDDEFKGGKAIRKFIELLFGSIDNYPKSKSQKEFIYKIQEQFKVFLNLKYVDTFKIERESNNWFCLFFFTNNKKGFQKMIEAKWLIDKKHGTEFKIGEDLKMDLFDEIEVSNYTEKVSSFLKNNLAATNIDLMNFGLENNFLPPHTKKVLDEIKLNHGIDIISLDGLPARSYYLGDEKRLVNIKIR